MCRGFVFIRLLTAGDFHQGRRCVAFIRSSISPSPLFVTQRLPPLSLLLSYQEALKPFRLMRSDAGLIFRPKELIFDHHQGAPPPRLSLREQRRALNDREGCLCSLVDCGGSNNSWKLPWCSSPPRMHHHKCDLLLADNDVPSLRKGRRKSGNRSNLHARLNRSVRWIPGLMGRVTSLLHKRLPGKRR